MTEAKMDAAIGRTMAEIFAVDGRSALVTGGASGLGLAIAEVLADCGANVTVADIDVQRLACVSAGLAGRPGCVHTALVDVADVAQVSELVAAVAARDGRLDIAFVNAGIAAASEKADGGLDGLDEAWDKVLAVNLTGAYATMQACAAVMRAQGSGRIVVTASTAGLRADPLVSSSYAAAKAALINLTRQAALELAPHGIGVNAIAPGPFRTNIGVPPGQEREPQDESRWNRTVPMGRMGDPAELKGLALLLASPASSFITGAVVPIDGGALINYAR
jgi:NAD(P)-dependent dehydrogenase (short-subunit alcohol dehydrogenase family)